MTAAPIVFESEEIAQHLVAGIPCAARAVLELAERGQLAPNAVLLLAGRSVWQNPKAISDEIARLTPQVTVEFGSLDESEPEYVVDGVVAVSSNAVGGADAELLAPAPLPKRSAKEARAALDKAGKHIVASTGKPTDGLVSEWINRPISQFISYHWLKLAWVRPIHATIAAAICGIAMAICLFSASPTGLVAGAILYQISSIIDGVDGEIARAARRSSKWGATLDTASDTVTNFGFITGVCFNIWRHGAQNAALVGLFGVLCLLVGLAVLGSRSMRAVGILNFDAIKRDAKATGSLGLAAAAKIASRDVYALVFAIMIVVGLAGPAMILFGACATIWLAGVLIMLARNP